MTPASVLTVGKTGQVDPVLVSGSSRFWEPWTTARGSEKHYQDPAGKGFQQGGISEGGADIPRQRIPTEPSQTGQVSQVEGLANAKAWGHQIAQPGEGRIGYWQIWVEEGVDRVSAGKEEAVAGGGEVLGSGGGRRVPQEGLSQCLEHPGASLPRLGLWLEERTCCHRCHRRCHRCWLWGGLSILATQEGGGWERPASAS